MDEFDRAMHDRLTALERMVSARDHDIETLVTALTKCEGGNETTTAYRHLGRTL